MLIESVTVESPQFRPILLDLRYFRTMALIGALVDCQIPLPVYKLDWQVGHLLRGLEPFWDHIIGHKGVSAYSTAEVIVKEVRIELYFVWIHDFSWQREIGAKIFLRSTLTSIYAIYSTNYIIFGLDERHTGLIGRYGYSAGPLGLFRPAIRPAC
jgi:hypothetical protein